MPQKFLHFVLSPFTLYIGTITALLQSHSTTPLSQHKLHSPLRTLQHFCSHTIYTKRITISHSSYCTSNLSYKNGATSITVHIYLYNCIPICATQRLENKITRP